MRLVTRISLLIDAIVLFISLSFGSIVIMVITDTQTESEKNALLNVARLGSVLLSSDIHSSLNIFQELANRIRTRSMDWEIQSSSLRFDIERSGFMDFGIVDKAEQARYIKDNTIADLHDREYIIQALSGKQAISDVLINRVINRPVIMYAVPITADDSVNAPVIGALIGRRDGDHLDAISTQVTYGKSGYAFLVSKTGTIIAHPDASLVLQQFNPITIAEQDARYRSFGDAVQTAIKGGEGIVEFIYKDKKLVAGYSAMPDFGWTLLVTVEHAEYMTGATKIRDFIILLALIFLIVGVSASIVLALFITKP